MEHFLVKKFFSFTFLVRIFLFSNIFQNRKFFLTLTKKNFSEKKIVKFQKYYSLSFVYFVV